MTATGQMDLHILVRALASRPQLPGLTPATRFDGEPHHRGACPLEKLLGSLARQAAQPAGR